MEAFFEKVIISHLLKKISFLFIEPRGLLPTSQERATELCPESDEFIVHPPILPPFRTCFYIVTFILIFTIPDVGQISEPPVIL
jgi:hypothetical protein